MIGPVWARWVFALVCVGVGVHCAMRLARTSRLAGTGEVCEDRLGDAAHLSMGVGMAVMFAPMPTPIPPLWWAAGFGLQTVWLIARDFRTRAAALVSGGPTIGAPHALAHVAGSVVMTGMFATMPADGLSGTGLPHAGHLTASAPWVGVAGWTAMVFFLGQTLICGARVAAPQTHGPGATSDPGVREQAATDHGGALSGAGRDALVRLLMGLGMSYMLLTML